MPNHQIRDIILPAGECANCHCLHQGIVCEDVLGLSIEERRKLQQEVIDNDDGEWEKELNARNKAKAGIDEDSIKMDWLKEKDKKVKLGILEAKTVDGVKVRRRKTLQELRNDGMITISTATINHSAIGTFTAPSKEYPNGRITGGGHFCEGKIELDKSRRHYKCFSGNIRNLYKDNFRKGYLLAK